MKYKSLLLKTMQEDLKRAKQKPSSSPSYNKNINRIKDKIKNVKTGIYNMKKSDLDKINKIAGDKTKKDIKDYKKSFDTDNISFYYWNKAKPSAYDLKISDMTVLIKFYVEGQKQYRFYGIISDRLDMKVSDQLINQVITENIQENSGGLTIQTGTGHISNVDSFQIVEAYR